MTEETMNDALDDILAESGDEEEEESIVNQVLDEIGIEISGKVRERDRVLYTVWYILRSSKLFVIVAIMIAMVVLHIVVIFVI